MANKCNHPSSRPGSFCGRPTYLPESKCKFHYYSSLNGVGDLSALQEYIAAAETDEIEFHQVKFKKPLFDNDGVKFDKPVLFSEVIFDGINLTKVIFHKKVTFQSVEFIGACSFPSLYKSTFEDCHFSACNFDRDLKMEGASFKSVSFRHTDVLGNMELMDCVLDDTQFIGTRFTGDRISFRRTSINSPMTPFNGCVFGTEGTESVFEIFECTIKTDAMPFRACRIKTSTFSLEASSIEGSRLPLMACRCPTHNAPLHLLLQSNTINLSRLAFTGHFEYSNHAECSSAEDYDPPEIDMSRIIFPHMASAVFLNANLERALFRYSVVENVHFVICQWSRGDDIDKRKTLYDVDNPPKEVETNSLFERIWRWELIRLFVQFKKNYEEQRNFIGACDWAYREMEQRKGAWTNTENKLSNKWSRRRDGFFYGLYKWLSAYGESYTRPLWWLLGFLALFTTINFYTGFYWDSPDKIQYAWNGKAIGMQNVWDFLKAGGATLSALVPFLGKSVKGTGIESSAIAIVESVIAAVLIPLFLLAVRRNFRR